MPRASTAPTVVITGASAGVGRASVRRFAEEGYQVALIARGKGGLRGAAEDVRRCGSTPLVLPCDVADADAVEAAAGRAENELGPIDVWVNNAMASVFSPVMQMTAAEFRRVTEVTYLGYVHGTLAALHRMASRDRGVIVQVGSALAYRSIPLQSAYCAAKHAIAGFTESLRCELLHEGSSVHVTQVHMPALNTPQFAWVKSRLPRKAQPVPPIFQPELAADAIYFAAHSRQREHWVAWPTVQAILADKVVPGLADLYLARQGYGSQQTDEPADPNQRDNLFEPVDDDGGGDFGARGTFSDRARRSSIQWTLVTSHRLLQTAAAACAGLVIGVATAAALDGRNGKNP